MATFATVVKETREWAESETTVRCSSVSRFIITVDLIYWNFFTE